MLDIHFDGWFQCRLATNPDPTDEPRGISGHTFALAGEPDLDRVIRFQDPVAPRSHGPEVGVTVTSVQLDGTELSDHALLGASVDLMDDAKFESRNKLLGDDRGGAGIIHPFRLRISCPTVSLERRDMLDPADPDVPLHRMPPSALTRRGPISPNGFVFDPETVARVTGIADGAAFRAARRSALEADLPEATDATERAALGKRIFELSIDDPNNIRTQFMHVTQTWQFAINGPALVSDKGGAIGLPIDVDQEWPVELWMGAWDADALCGYVQGVLRLPVVALP